MNPNLSTALFCTSLPVNPRPFLNGLGDLVTAGEPLTSDYAKRILWTLVAIVRGQMASINLAGNAKFHSENLERLPGRTTPTGVILAMIREADGLGTADIRRNWSGSISSLILFAWGDSGTLNLPDEWVRLHDAWQEQRQTAA